MDKRYQVFISSTFADLEDERKGIMQAIIELDCFPAGMEMFPATDSEQFDYIKTIIDESDYYVLIVAGRYGSVDDDGMSYTEKEFAYAKEKGIPILAFVKKDIKSIPVDKTDDDPKKRKKLESFRAKVLDGRMASFWDTADELKYKIHSSLSKEFKLQPRMGWVRSNTIPSYEALEQINLLQEENKQLSIKLQDFQREKDKNRDFDEKANKFFSIDFYVKNTLDFAEECNASIKEIVSMTGLFLSSGIYLEEFKKIINNKIVIPRTFYGDADITVDSLQDIETKMLALGIIDIIDYSDTLLKFTDLGMEFFRRSVDF